MAVEKVGWLDKGELHESLFCTITDTRNHLEVTGLITSISESISAQWENRMDKDNMDDKVPWTALLQTGGLGQITDSALVEKFMGRTHYTKSQSRLVWTGQTPLNFELELTFVAFKDASIEVGLAVQYLQKMVSPNLRESFVDSYKEVLTESITSLQNGTAPDWNVLDTILGYVPSHLTISLLDGVFASEFILTDVSWSDSEMLRTKNGERAVATVSCSFQTVTSLNETDIADITKAMQSEADLI